MKSVGWAKVKAPIHNWLNTVKKLKPAKVRALEARPLAFNKVLIACKMTY
jgi:hypothetical protein